MGRAQVCVCTPNALPNPQLDLGKRKKKGRKGRGKGEEGEGGEMGGESGKRKREGKCVCAALQSYITCKLPREQ